MSPLLANTLVLILLVSIVGLSGLELELGSKELSCCSISKFMVLSRVIYRVTFNCKVTSLRSKVLKGNVELSETGAPVPSY